MCSLSYYLKHHLALKVIQMNHQTYSGNISQSLVEVIAYP